MMRVEREAYKRMRTKPLFSKKRDPVCVCVCVCVCVYIYTLSKDTKRGKNKNTTHVVVAYLLLSMCIV